MANIDITIMHPTDNSSAEVTVDTHWSADFAISELVRNGFLKELANADREEYRLVYKENMTEFRGETTFESVGVESGKVVSVVIRPKAGCNYTPYTGNGLICGSCRAGAYEIRRTEKVTDENGKTSVTEIYVCKNCGNEFRFDVYKES